MNITFDEQNRIFCIETENTSYVMAVVDRENFLAHLYYGEKIQPSDAPYLLKLTDPFFCVSERPGDRVNFMSRFPFEISSDNVGDYRESTVSITDKNGQGGLSFSYKSHRIYDGKEKLEGLPSTYGDEKDSKTLEIILKDDIVGLKAVLSYSVFEGVDAVTRSMKLINESDDEIVLDKVMSLTMDMDDDGFELLTLSGEWGRERMINVRPIECGDTCVQSVCGKSSHQTSPFIALVQNGDSQAEGKVYGISYVYSGNFKAGVSKSSFGSLRAYMGISPVNFKWILEKGETFTAPEAVMVFSDKGTGPMTRTFHDLFRKHLIRGKFRDVERPVLINNWEATYFKFDSDKLLSIAREAKKCGIEMLVMDDGWFGERDNDGSSLGDWFVNEKKIKGGLKKLVDDVNKIGLKFGIWMEPEMISPVSELYKAHPDWAIKIHGRTAAESRHQYVLDLSRREVVEYVYDCISKILKSANIEYLKWDMNRQLSDLGSSWLGSKRQGELCHRYMLAVYELQERLTKDFPNVLLENCSGGGGRFDAGMLYYSPQIWCSDTMDSVYRLMIHEGTALVFPLSTMGAHVGACPPENIARQIPFKTRGDVALAGTFGYELDITQISAEDRNDIPRQIAEYHKYNRLVRSGDYYRLASYRTNHLFDAYEVVAKDRSEALITFVQVSGEINVKPKILKIYGLDDNRRYLVEGTEDRLLGETLRKVGLKIPKKYGDYKSALIHLIGE